jgi:hypothetical protein
MADINMGLDENPLLKLVLTLTWTCITTYANEYKHCIFFKVLSTQDIVRDLLYATSLTFASGLFEVLGALTPPSISYFTSLPTDPKKKQKLWAVYLLVLEKPNCRPRVYLGSGT